VGFVEPLRAGSLVVVSGPGQWSGTRCLTVLDDGTYNCTTAELSVRTMRVSSTVVPHISKTRAVTDSEGIEDYQMLKYRANSAREIAQAAIGVG